MGANATAFTTSHVVTTELGRINQLSASVATKFLQLTDTTLNHKYKVLENEPLTTFPRIRYFGIGINGCSAISSENNIVQPWVPRASNMDLYEPIPFRCTATPLPSDEALKYRMVTRQSVNGVKYYMYWLKLLEIDDQPKITQITGNRQSSYALDTSNLYPHPTDLVGSDVSNSGGTRTQASVTAIRRVTGAEIQEAINIIYNGDLRRARISEFGLYSGIEKTATIEGVDGSYPEAAYVQLASHMCCIGHDLSNPRSSIVEQCVIQNGTLITD